MKKQASLIFFLIFFSLEASGQPVLELIKERSKEFTQKAEDFEQLATEEEDRAYKSWYSSIAKKYRHLANQELLWLYPQDTIEKIPEYERKATELEGRATEQEQQARTLRLKATLDKWLEEQARKERAKGNERRATSFEEMAKKHRQKVQDNPEYAEKQRQESAKKLERALELEEEATTLKQLAKGYRQLITDYRWLAEIRDWELP